ncbi:hypothetical protein AAJ76_2050003476 [Vairimorpha ceranae]|uniref:Uncharacterized protein n=1 Tax=Vairimorpha ceranae TaxID=40302 RepID=A0A0F9YM47_9MICR|nr:hypothetical protein AAJ76_2050003476 [Vairimorpha ceranae]KKO73847.1 hypothetical protein AAJ76_2050003476 [Vairimorpha ceranae]
MKLINHLSYINLVWFQERALWRTFLVLVAFLRFSPQQFVIKNNIISTYIKAHHIH